MNHCPGWEEAQGKASEKGREDCMNGGINCRGMCVNCLKEETPVFENETSLV